MVTCHVLATSCPRRVRDWLLPTPDPSLPSHPKVCPPSHPPFSLSPLAALPSISLPNETVWTFLGATDDQRIATCQVAVARTVYTMVKDTCLAGRSAKSLLADARNRMVAFLCTLLGGPVGSDARCKYADPRTGRQLTAPSDLFSALHDAHKG